MTSIRKTKTKNEDTCVNNDIPELELLSSSSEITSSQDPSECGSR